MVINKNIKDIVTAISPRRRRGCRTWSYLAGSVVRNSSCSMYVLHFEIVILSRTH
jgi:hypothetical protein